MTERKREKVTPLPGHSGMYRVPPSRRFHKGSYEVRYRDDLNRTRRKRFQTLKEAVDFRAGVRSDILKGDYVNPTRARMTLAEVAVAWQGTLAHRRRPKTVERAESLLRVHVLPAST